MNKHLIVTSLLLSTSPNITACDNNILFTGLGTHNERLDKTATNFRGNKLATVSYTHLFKNHTAFKISHTSNPMTHKDGWGFNPIFYGVYITW